LSSRHLTAPAATLVVALAFWLLLASPVAAQTPDPGQRIVDVAMRSLNAYEGQCFPWVRRVVAEATGTAMGFGYREGYLSGGAVEVPLGEVRTGDVIQIADDADNGPGASYAGLHTAIVLSRQANGLLHVIDSNSQWDGIVRLRPDYDPVGLSARYPGLTARAYRFSTSGDDGITEAAQSATLTPGTNARVSADGDCLNLRSGPGTDSAKILCIPDGSTVAVLDGSVESGGLQWQYVQYGGNAGWVAAAFLTPLASSSTPTPTPSPTPLPTGGTTGGAASGTISGSLPVDGGPGLIVWNGGTVQALVTAAASGGCSVRSVWSTVDGRFVGYTAGAPSFVNVQWGERYPDAVPALSPLIVICAGAGSTPTPTPTPSGTTSPPSGDAPPGPAGNEA
jgi:uncharacterized protein YraI